MLGLTSNQEYGTFVGTGQTTGLWGFTYSSNDVDSGAPVTTIGSSVKLYGMHTSNTVNYSFAAHIL